MKVGGVYRLEDAVEFFERKGIDELQSCFDYTVFCLARDQYFASSFDSDTLLTVFSETVSGIKHYFSGLMAKTPKREKAIAAFLELLASLTTTEQEDNKQQLLTLMKNSACIRKHKETLQVVLPS
ncbi:MAG: hypothetical protein LBD75_00475 [Candidatus Peribacteria bacterium]|jgi:hypothetical protein|nr:hypothetical protein [Candidatus Peribacteria bacterium]